LNAQMTAFRKHLRADKDAKDYMWGMARSLTDQDIVDISRFFATRPIPVGIHGNEALTAIGREIFKSGIPAKNLIACQTCHGVEARGLGSFPGLAGQHAFYIKRQLSYFASGERSEDPTMGPIAKVMSPAEISAVAEYLQSL
jgi:cytochrome c553